jgi:PleD family two-component response regulator
MILVYSFTKESKLRIVSLLKHQTDMAIAVAPTQEEVLELAHEHRPETIFLFMPGKPDEALEIQKTLRKLLPHSRVRILPSLRETEILQHGWQGVIVRALRQPKIHEGSKKESEQ